jgi:hypothetical protein
MDSYPVRKLKLQDAWTAVRLEGPRAIANSWSCYVVRLDLETGDEIARTFPRVVGAERPELPRVVCRAT